MQAHAMCNVREKVHRGDWQHVCNYYKKADKKDLSCGKGPGCWVHEMTGRESEGVDRATRQRQRATTAIKDHE
jgi:hypothetical protein